MENSALKIQHWSSEISDSVSQYAKTPFPTLQPNSTKGLALRRHKKKCLTRSRTQVHPTLWSGGKINKTALLQFYQENQLDQKVKIHEPEYLEAMTEVYSAKDLVFFEQLVSISAMFRVGSDSLIEKWIWTEEEDFLEAYRWMKTPLTPSLSQPYRVSKSTLEVLNCIQIHFFSMPFTTFQLRAYVLFNMGTMESIIGYLVKTKQIQPVGRMGRYRTYKLNKNYNL